MAHGTQQHPLEAVEAAAADDQTQDPSTPTTIVGGSAVACSGFRTITTGHAACAATGTAMLPLVINSPIEDSRRDPSTTRAAPRAWSHTTFAGVPSTRVSDSSRSGCRPSTDIRARSSAVCPALWKIPLHVRHGLVVSGSWSAPTGQSSACTRRSGRPRRASAHRLAVGFGALSKRVCGEDAGRRRLTVLCGSRCGAVVGTWRNVPRVVRQGALSSVATRPCERFPVGETVSTRPIHSGGGRRVGTRRTGKGDTT